MSKTNLLYKVIIVLSRGGGESLADGALEGKDDVILGDVEPDPAIDAPPSRLHEQQTAGAQTRAQSVQLSQVGWLHSCGRGERGQQTISCGEMYIYQYTHIIIIIAVLLCMRICNIPPHWKVL